MNPIELSLFSGGLAAICEEMGVTLQRAAFSPNIKDRLDFSCAVFGPDGGLAAQAAHIPVHLGSMAFALRGIVGRFDWRDGDRVLVNDPFLGGTHLPDLTVIAPVFGAGRLCGFVADRAHHARIGAGEPGAMPLSRRLEDEGVVIAPTRVIAAGALTDAGAQVLARLLDDPASAPPPGPLAPWLEQRELADVWAQLSAATVGLRRLAERLGNAAAVDDFLRALAALDAQADRITGETLASLPRGTWQVRDVLDDDGQGHGPIPLLLALSLDGERMVADFTGSSAQVAGNLNCPLAVTAAAVIYVLRCLLPSAAPVCHGMVRRVRVLAPVGCLLNAERPAAVAAGNVETSQRCVDLVLAALGQALPERIPAASQGTMNNLAMGAAATADRARWDYYETLAGGCGASAVRPGRHACQSHMTNTLNTPIEVLEREYPLRVRRYAIRRGSGGAGRHGGGDGVVREFEFLAPARVTLLTERRLHGPPGLAGGAPGATGENRLNGRPLPGKVALDVGPGDRLELRTPGGGGHGASPGDPAPSPDADITRIDDGDRRPARDSAGEEG